LAYRPARIDAAGPTPAPVRVRYAAPQALRAVTPAGDTVVFAAVRELTGQVAAARGDTVDLDVHTVNGAPPPGPGTRARVVLADGRRVEVERFDPVRSAGLTLLVAGLAAAAAFASALSQLGDSY
jgi:hypothetical protein